MSEPFVFDDPRSKVLLEQLERVATKDGSVLITGPTGSGKEIVARLVHRHSARRDGPFVPLHCGAISENLFESQLFGHVKGAFSGAVKEHGGYLAEADGGVLFLDELGELPLEHQVKLLRVLDGYPYRPVGGGQERTVDVRFIGATNRDLEAMCRDGRFRDDLYGRISHFVLRVPPLAERPADIRALVRVYCEQHRPGDAAFAGAVEAAALRLSEEPEAWPLGIRQVQAFVSRADCFGVDETEHDLHSEWQRRRKPVAPAVRAPAVDSDDRQALAGLIQAKLQSKKGKSMLAASRSASLALAELLLGGGPVPHGDIQAALNDCDRRTLHSNLRPLVEVGLLEDDGERATLVWPPVLIRFFSWQGDAWVQVPPGAIPLARGSDRLRVEVTAQLPIMVRIYVVTHRRTGSEPRRRVAEKLVARDQTKPIDLELDDDPGFEQILIHLAWPTKRGLREIDSESAVLDAPRLHTLHRERLSLLEHAGPGWLEEYLVHHL